MRTCWFAIILVVLAVPNDANAQLSSVTGEVLDAQTNTALGGANVRLVGEGEQRGTATGRGGRFSFPGLPPGTYVLVVTHVGFDAWSDTLEVAFSQDIRVVVELAATSEELDEVVVESDDEDRPVAAAGAGHLRISPAALQNVPMPDVSPDLAAFLLTQPGIISPGDRGGQLFIRGGTPTQNLVLMDGMHIYRPFHIVGFYSIFPADIIAYADVYAGGFGADYGGRIGSVVDVVTRNGSKQHFAGSASIAPFLASLRAEIPVVPGKVSLVTSVRESVIERVSPTLIDTRLPYRFGDRFAKIHAFLNRTSSFTATVLHSFDEGDIAAANDGRYSRWTNTAAGGRYFYLPADFPATAEFAMYGTRYQSRFSPDDGEERVSDVTTFELKIRFAYLLGDFQMRAGIGGMTNWLDYDLGPGHEPQQQNFTEGGLYFSADWNAEYLRLSPGVRVQTYSFSSRTLFEPRIRFEWRPGGGDSRQRFTGAWGIYHQQFLGLNNQRDVTDAFTAWTASPEHAPLPRSMHLLLGTQRRLHPSLTIGLEGYLRDISNIHFPDFESGLSSLSQLERVHGEARGLEATVEFLRPGLYAHAGYGLSLVEYRELLDVSGSERSLGPAFTPPHDRRHNLSLQARLSLGAYQIQVGWQYGSGVPFTPILQYYYASPPRNTEDRQYLTDGGTAQTMFGPSYSRRLPAYHRLDVTAERRFQFDGWRLVAHLGVINAYDRHNIFAYDVLGRRRIDQLPLIPSGGIRVEIDG